MSTEALKRQMKRTAQARRELEKIRDELESVGITDLEEEANPFESLILSKQEIFNARKTLQRTKPYNHVEYVQKLIEKRYITAAHTALLIGSIADHHQKDAFFVFLPYIVDPENVLAEVKRVLRYGFEYKECAKEYRTLERAGMLCQVHADTSAKDKIAGLSTEKKLVIAWVAITLGGILLLLIG